MQSVNIQIIYECKLRFVRTKSINTLHIDINGYSTSSRVSLFNTQRTAFHLYWRGESLAPNNVNCFYTQTTGQFPITTIITWLVCISTHETPIAWPICISTHDTRSTALGVSTLTITPPMQHNYVHNITLFIIQSQLNSLFSCKTLY